MNTTKLLAGAAGFNSSLGRTTASLSQHHFESTDGVSVVAEELRRSLPVAE